MMDDARGGGLVAALAVFAGGCGVGPGEPAITAFRFAGQARDSPFVLLLEADFVDDDGDLSRGFLETFINKSPTSAGLMSLLPVFVRSGVGEWATSGTLEFVLELAFPDPPPPRGTSFALGARVTDAAGNASAVREVRLTLEETE